MERMEKLTDRFSLGDDTKINLPNNVSGLISFLDPTGPCFLSDPVEINCEPVLRCDQDRILIEFGSGRLVNVEVVLCKVKDFDKFIDNLKRLKEWYESLFDGNVQVRIGNEECYEKT